MEIDPPYEKCYLILYFTIYRQNYLCQTTFNELKDVKYALRITQAISILPKTGVYSCFCYNLWLHK